MKKITLCLLILLSFSLGYTQNTSLPIGFENGPVNPMVAFDCAGACPAAAIIANPDQSGINTSANVYEYVRNAGVAWYSGFIFDQTLRTTPVIDIAVTGKVFTLKVWATKAPVDVRFQLEQGFPNAGVSPAFERFATINTANQWVTLTFDFTSQVELTDAMAYNAFSIFPDWNPGNQANEDETDTYYFDDIIATGASEPTCDDGIQNGLETGVDCGGPDCPTCPETCNDGIQNQDETGIDCGGVCGNPCPPTTDAPQSGSTGTDLYVYSGLTGTSVTEFNFNAFSGPGGVGVSQVDIEGNGNQAGLVTTSGGFFFYGAQWTPVDLTAGGYQFVHINYYATTATEFKVFLIDPTANIPGGNPAEPRYTFGSTGDEPLVAGEWRSVFIPLQHFLDFNSAPFSYDLNDIFQWKFEGNGNIYFDNVFFSTTNTLSNDEFSLNDFKVFPNPSKTEWTVNAANDVIKSIQLVDVLGKQVLSITPNTSIAKIDASQLNKGLYFANIVSNNGSSTIKLIKN